MDDTSIEPEEIAPETRAAEGAAPETLETAETSIAVEPSVAPEVPVAPEIPEAPEPPAAASPVETPSGPVAPTAAGLPPGADSVHDLGAAVMTPHGPEYPRFRLMARIEHMTLLVSFTILCLTGLPQKFPFSPVSQGLIQLLGGIEVARMIHRWAAVVLVLGTVYHLLTSAYRLFVKREDMRMLPELKDGYDLRDTVAYNLGFSDEPPRMPKFNFGEKFEYWAVVWGTGVMIFTGFILWNPLAATQFIPGNLIPVSLEAHGWEAVLAAVQRAGEAPQCEHVHRHPVTQDHGGRARARTGAARSRRRALEGRPAANFDPTAAHLFRRRRRCHCPGPGPGHLDVHIRGHGHHRGAGSDKRCVCPTGNP